MLSWIPWTLLALDWIARLSLAVVVIMRRRPVVTRLAWLVVLIFVPVVGVVAYIFVGENRLGRRRVRRYEQLTKGIEIEAARVWHHRYAISQEDEAWSSTAVFGTNATGFPPLKGNTVKLLSHADAFIDHLCVDIGEAKEHVHILTYIWQPTGAGERVVEALVKAAKRGVRCRVLVDAVGSRPFLRSELVRTLRQAGIPVVQALPVGVVRGLFARLDLRNHRKIAVIDGKIAYTGSQNLTDDKFRSKPWRKTGPWIDASVRVVGPAVYAMQAVFLRDWLLDTNEQMGPIERYLPEIAAENCEAGTTDPAEAPQGTAAERGSPGCSVVQLIPSGPGPTPDAIHQAVLTTIYHAREELILTTPYFVPDDATRAALEAAAMRGVKTTLIVPTVSDSILVAAASRGYYQDLLEAGVHILEYKGGLLHAKTLTVDRKIVLLGSANLDVRSFWLNFEATLFVYDSDVAGMVRLLQMSYADKSTEVLLPEWKRRSLLDKFRCNVAQLVGPLL